MVKMIYLILVPAVILVIAIADKVLLLFGSSYAENVTTLLRIMAISTLPLGINLAYLAIKRVEKKLRVIVGISIFMAVLCLGLAYLLLPKLGINGVGIAYLTSQMAVALVVVASSVKGRQTVSRVRALISKR